MYKWVFALNSQQEFIYDKEQPTNQPINNKT